MAKKKPYGEAARAIREEKIKNQIIAAEKKKYAATSSSLDVTNAQAEIIKLETERRALDTLYNQKDDE